jgi:copper chaperone CopZ
MTCGSCVVHITKAVHPLPGVASVKVDLRAETVTVRREPALVSSAALAAALADAGYDAHLDEAIVIPNESHRSFLARLRGR